MTTIESSKLLLMRVQKAVGLINRLRDENKELQARFELVETGGYRRGHYLGSQRA